MQQTTDISTYVQSSEMLANDQDIPSKAADYYTLYRLPVGVWFCFVTC